MKPYFRKAGVTIFHGDSREILPTLEAKSVDLVLTDPPYNVSRENICRTIRGAGANAGTFHYGKWDYAFEPRAVSQELMRIISENGQFYIFASSVLLPEWISCLRDCFEWKVLLWTKPDPLPQIRQRHWISAAEYILWFWRDKYTFNWLGHSSMFSWQMMQAPKVKAQRFHPNQKPLALLVRYLEVSSEPRGTVLDPFMGSGTTLLAAQQLKRRAIGIEIEERYCEIAARRLEGKKALPAA